MPLVSASLGLYHFFVITIILIVTIINLIS